jgi:2-hydroxy-3-oxopropionate reductase
MHRYPIGVAGLGAIGMPIAKNLSSNVELQVWNRNQAKYSFSSGSAIHQLSHLTDFDASIILTVLPSHIEVFEILAKGLLEVLAENDLLVVMGTVSPQSMHDINTLLLTKGARAVDAPVSGGDIGAQEGQLSIMVGGLEGDFERVKPFLLKTAKSFRYVGPLGTAQALKAANQIIVGGNLVAIAEGLTLTRRYGISDEDFFEVISNGLAGSAVLNAKWSKIQTADFAKGGKSSFQLKDLEIALKEAAQLNLNLPLTELVASLYK